MTFPTDVLALDREPQKNEQADKTREFNWTPIIYFYIIYLVLIFIGAAANVHTSFLGATVFLVLLLAWYWRQLLTIRIDKLFFFTIVSTIAPVVPMLSFDTKMYFSVYQEMIKYYALNLIILIAASLPLTPIGKSRKNWLLYLAILLFLVIGMIWPSARGLQDSRVKGFLANPNNFALTAMMLAMLVNEERPRSFIKFISYGIVMCFIYMSKTAGALLGYTSGLIFKFIHKNAKLSMLRFLMLMFVLFVAILSFAAIPRGTLKPVDETIKKITVTKNHLPKIFSRRQINFYEIEVRERQNVTSGLWRFVQWHKITNFYLDSSITAILFGHGIGATDVYFKLKSHNDYLRLLAETGIVGLVINLSIWIILYHRMDKRYRWMPVMMAIYCFTENNYDHFPAMSLLVFYMSGARNR